MSQAASQTQQQTLDYTHCRRARAEPDDRANIVARAAILLAIVQCSSRAIAWGGKSDDPDSISQAVGQSPALRE